MTYLDEAMLRWSERKWYVWAALKAECNSENPKRMLNGERKKTITKIPKEINKSHNI